MELVEEDLGALEPSATHGFVDVEDFAGCTTNGLAEAGWECFSRPSLIPVLHFFLGGLEHPRPTWIRD